jgi:hypothetical protein
MEFNARYIITLLMLGSLTGYFAYRKGYSFILWFLTCGALVPLLLLLTLPKANQPDLSLIEQKKLRHEGDKYAIFIDIVLWICLVFLIFLPH